MSGVNFYHPQIQTVQTEEVEQPKVTQRITAAGYYYRLRSGGEEIGPFTLEEEQDAQHDDGIASTLGVEAKDVLAARLHEIRRPVTFEDVKEVLATTIIHDDATKLILFGACLLTFTSEDQVSVYMTGESGGGKSYNALEIVDYFKGTPDTVIELAGASPSSFFHQQGTWDPERRTVTVNLRQKIIVFLDAPDYRLLEKLRPLSSHDRPNLVYQIVDKNRSGGNRTKTIIILGYPTFVNCSVKPNLDDQEKTRAFQLSPETSQEKLQESIRLRISREADRKAFTSNLDSHPQRRWLKSRIQQIKESHIDQIIIPNIEDVRTKFLAGRSKLAPRHPRDVSRIMSLIKASALLNCWSREHPESNPTITTTPYNTEHTIIANQADIEAGFNLYDKISESNEIGLSPEIYQLWTTIIKPLIEGNNGYTEKKTIMAEYYKTLGRHLPPWRLTTQIIPALESCGLILLEPDPADKRRSIIRQATEQA